MFAVSKSHIKEVMPLALNLVAKRSTALVRPLLAARIKVLSKAWIVSRNCKSSLEISLVDIVPISSTGKRGL